MLVFIVKSLFRYNILEEDEIPVEHHGQPDVRWMRVLVSRRWLRGVFDKEKRRCTAEGLVAGEMGLEPGGCHCCSLTR